MDEHSDQDEERKMTATEAVLTNQDLMETIIQMVRDIEGHRVRREFSHLRLVSRTFNNAVLNLPPPFPFHLNLAVMFPQLLPDLEDLTLSDQITPVAHEDIPPIPQQLARNVGMTMTPRPWGDGGRGENCPKAVILGNFCSIYGSSIRILSLTGVTEGQLPLVAQTLDTSCPNLMELSLGLSVCECEDDQGGRDDFTFSTTKPKLTSLKVRDGTVGDKVFWERWQGVCHVLRRMVSALVGASPNLVSLETHGNMFVDLRGHGMLKRLNMVIIPGKPSASTEALMNMLTGPSRTLQTMKLRFDSIGSLENAGLVRAMERELRLPPFPNLEVLNLIFRLRFNFGPALASLIFSPNTANLRTWTLVAPVGRALEDFLLVIRDNAQHFVNRSLEKLVLVGSAAPIPHLPYLTTAFPNMRAAVLTARLEHPDDGEMGMLNLTNVLRSTVGGWKVLEDLNLRMDFPITFEGLQGGLEDLGEDFWRNGSVRRVTLEFEDVPALFPAPYDMEPDTDVLEYSLLAMRGLERVTLHNLMMPAGVTQSLLRFIAENNLPVSFLGD